MFNLLTRFVTNEADDKQPFSNITLVYSISKYINKETIVSILDNFGYSNDTKISKEIVYAPSKYSKKLTCIVFNISIPILNDIHVNLKNIGCNLDDIKIKFGQK